jgi:hypothetical protein
MTRNKTARMLMKWAVMDHLSYRRLKRWWNGLSALERTEMKATITNRLEGTDEENRTDWPSDVVAARRRKAPPTRPHLHRSRIVQK